MLKRLLDIVIASSALVLLSPVYAFVAYKVRKNLGSPVLFRQVRPGITGYAQVNGRNAISWEKKFELDTWYVENRSLWLDFKIMLKTVQKVLSKDDISAEGEATISKFTGTSEPKDD